ncbi:hypothetical protein [Avibacterium paragallinarum]|uniref:hypothetical protein n=1 Tax=Avibacterium paragallinarum TaxID=728 RepID=UPI0015B57914|nr:hypothetical protein [Avibacterium paragallinarum]QLD65637.1 hypothetical protein VY92_010085 [Avibacterium paragallinarum]
MTNFIQTVFKIGLFSIFTFFSQFSSADIDAELIDDMVQVNPLISLRSLETGVPLINGQYKDQRNFQWIISEVPASETTFKKAGLTQFRVPGLERCLYTIQNRLISESCDPKDAGSLWVIIPTVLGGVEIKSMRTNTCLSAGRKYNDYRLAPCQENEKVTVSPNYSGFFLQLLCQQNYHPRFPLLS